MRLSGWSRRCWRLLTPPCPRCPHQQRLTRSPLAAVQLRRLLSTTPSLSSPSTPSSSSSSSPFTVTTPIFYVNGPPHLGHLYTALLADALTRTHRLLSRPTHLITGTDEHGNKVKHAATVHSTSPLAFATAQSARYRALFDAAAVSYSTYMRTTDAHHQRVVQHVWQRMEASGDIYLGRHEGWYCTAEEAFIPLNQTEERQRKGEVVRVNSANGLPVEWQSEENFMFRLSKYQQPLLDWLTSSPTSPVQPPSRRPEVLTLLSAPLADLSVSRLRSNADWGIPVPSHPSHTIYVWFDALLNYLSACIDPSSLPSSTTPSPPPPSLSPSPLWPPSVQVVGKDILRFHAVYWPAFLLSLSLPLPHLLFAHGHWTVDGRKMSKSLGNVIDPSTTLTHMGQDALRWSLLTSSTHTDDSDWSQRDMIQRYNAELAHTLGNLLSRCLAPALLPSGELPKGPAGRRALGVKEMGQVAELVGMEEEVMERFRLMDFAGGVQVVLRAMRGLNGYFTEEKPWELKKEGKQEKLDTVLYLCLEGCRMAAILLQPIIPQGSARILDRLAVPEEQRNLAHIGFGRDAVTFPQDSSVIFAHLRAEVRPPQPPSTSASPDSDSSRSHQSASSKRRMKKNPTLTRSAPTRHTAAVTRLQPPPPPLQAQAAAPLQEAPQATPASSHQPLAATHPAGARDGAPPMRAGAHRALRPHPHPVVQHVADGAEGRREQAHQQGHRAPDARLGSLPLPSARAAAGGAARGDGARRVRGLHVQVLRPLRSTAPLAGRQPHLPLSSPSLRLPQRARRARRSQHHGDERGEVRGHRGGAGAAHRDRRSAAAAAAAAEGESSTRRQRGEAAASSSSSSSSSSGGRGG